MPAAKPPRVAEPQQTPASRRRTPSPSRRASLAAITGWQEERRRALMLLDRQYHLARDRGDFGSADAYLFAAIDIRHVLRERAAFVIAESCEMRWAHQAV